MEQDRGMHQLLGVVRRIFQDDLTGRGGMVTVALEPYGIHSHWEAEPASQLPQPGAIPHGAQAPRSVPKGQSGGAPPDPPPPSCQQVWAPACRVEVEGSPAWTRFPSWFYNQPQTGPSLPLPLISGGKFTE